METQHTHKQKEQIKKLQLHKEDRFHVVELTMKAGALLKQHTSVTDAFLVVTEGEIAFFIHNGEHRLKKGDTFAFKAGEQHAVHAITDASFLLVK
jgi:quercetin dioxygenase-like cupin family protein